MPVRKKSKRNPSRLLIESLEKRQLLSAGLTVTYGSDGISTLAYNTGITSSTLINVPAHSNDAYWIPGYYVVNSNGSMTWNSGSTSQTSWTPASNGNGGTLTYNYSWGSIACTYTEVGTTRLNFAFTVKNTSSNVTIGGVDIDPATIRFPGALPYPYNSSVYYPLVDWGFDGPNVQPANYGSGVMAMVDDTVNPAPDTNSQLYAGLNTNSDTSTNNDWTMWVGTAPEQSQNSSWPVFNTPVAPGGTDNFEVSLRFGPAGTDPYKLATDVEQAWATVFPDQVNWPDRRPIGQLNLTSSPAAGVLYPDNPEGWLNDSSTINVTTQAGLNNFAPQLLTWAENALAVLQADNAQGMITWDIEGQTWPQATSYIGDPSLAFNTTIQNAVSVTYNGGTTYTTTTPMGYIYTGPGALYNPTTGAAESLADQYFQIFSSAGLRVGVTIRPTVIQFVNGVPEQEAPPAGETEANVLATKMEYAYGMWGCTLFYLDSNSGYDNDQLEAAMQQFNAVYPNVNALIMPEHSTTGTYAYAAPYGQVVTYGFTGTPELAYLTYPNAFSVIYIANATSSVLNPLLPAIEKSVARGDTILFRGWFADSYNTTMEQIFQAVDKAPPTTIGLAVSQGASVIDLSWTPVTGAGNFESGAYNVLRSNSSGGPFTTYAYGVMGTTYADTGVTSGQTYYYEVEAVDPLGAGNPSSAVSGTATAGPTIVNAASAVDVAGQPASWTLSALGADVTGETPLTYTWTSVGPTGAPAPNFSTNGTTTSSTVVATFYQAGTYALAVTITDKSNLSITSSVNVVVNLAVATPASAAPPTVTGDTAALSVLGSDSAGESTLTYTWACVSVPANAPPPFFSANGTNAAKNTVATFNQAGTYNFTVTIRDMQGLSTTSNVTVVVSQTVTTMYVQPPKTSVAVGGTVDYSVLATDQFSNPITSPTVVWSVGGGGTMNGSVFTATTDGTFTVTAVSDGYTATTTVTVTGTGSDIVTVTPLEPVTLPSSPTPTPTNPTIANGTGLASTTTTTTGGKKTDIHAPKHSRDGHKK
jgi:hypothetical protein